MTDPDNITIRHLQAIRAKQDDQGELLAQISVQLSAMGQQLAGLTAAVYSGKTEMDSLKRRVERIERRLELRESD